MEVSNLEESINPTITLGPVTFNLTLLAMTLISVLVVLALFIGPVENDDPTKGQTKCAGIRI